MSSTRYVTRVSKNNIGHIVGFINYIDAQSRLGGEIHEVSDSTLEITVRRWDNRMTKLKMHSIDGASSQGLWVDSDGNIFILLWT